MSSSNWKGSRLKRAEETGSRSTYSWPPPRRTLSFISRLSLFPAYKVNSRTTTTHTCIPLITFEEQRESPSKTIFESPSMGRRKTANCTFKFSFPLLPPPPLLTLSPKLEEDRSNKGCADKPSCGFIRGRTVSVEIRRRATRQFSRNIYNPRILACLSHTPTEYRYHHQCSILLFAMPSRNLDDIDGKSSLPSKRGAETVNE